MQNINLMLMSSVHSVRIRPAILLPNQITAGLLGLLFQVYAKVCNQFEQVSVLICLLSYPAKKCKARTAKQTLICRALFNFQFICNLRE